MTTFILSHNLQVHSEAVPSFDNQDLAEGLKSCSNSIIISEVINHPHWIIKITSQLSPAEFADELVRAWKAYRLSLGHQTDHTILALGGKKDTDAMPTAPLQKDFWGVDLVEVVDKSAFLKSISWEMLKASRNPDNIFEVYL